jgi:thymidylate kinase
MLKRGAVFAFEGPDGVGKTTLVSAAEQILKGLSHSVLAVSFPGRAAGTLGAHIYDLHHRPAEHSLRALTPDALQVLHIAAHVDTIQSVIRPHVEGGGIVLLDRYWWSTWVYGLLGGVQISSLKRMIALERAYWGRLAPQAIFLVTRPSADINPDERPAFIQRVREYDKLARQAARSPVLRVDNCGDISSVAAIPVRVILDNLRSSALSDHIGLRNPITGSAPSLNELQMPLYGDGVESAGPTPGPSTPDLPSVWSPLIPPKPTAVFDTYWRFATERQAIFFRRLKGVKSPWTEDAILHRYKFTNAYRASDRVSQYLIRQVIYAGDQSPRELFFRILLFKFFNRIETWQRLVAALGEPSAKTFVVSTYDKVLTTILESGDPIYSGAYIMPSGGARWGEARKHRMHLRLLDQMLSEGLPERVLAAPAMRDAFDLLKTVPTLGDFLAYQYVTDLNYSSAMDFSESEFVVPGPGARDGIRKCFSSLGDLTEADVIRFVHEHQQEEFDKRQLPFKSLWGRQLQLIDCQNLFCEVDKYARVYHPDVKGNSGRARIKQRFRPAQTPLSYWFPPKWGLNEHIGDVGEAAV